MKAVWSQDPVTFRARDIQAAIEDRRSQPQRETPSPIWIGGSSDAAIDRAPRLDGWHGSRVRPEAAAVKRFRAVRRGGDFTVSIRVNINENNIDDMRPAPACYRDAGIQHVMAAPEDREIGVHMKTVERFARAGDGL